MYVKRVVIVAVVALAAPLWIVIHDRHAVAEQPVVSSGVVSTVGGSEVPFHERYRMQPGPDLGDIPTF